MLQIVKAEFRYVWHLILVVMTLILSGFQLYFRVSDRGGFAHILLPLAAAIILQVIVIRSIEKRDRLFATLPVDLRLIARARVLLFLAPVICLHAIYFALYFVLRQDSVRWHHDIFDVLMFFGLVLFGSAAYFIQHDIMHSRFKINPEIDVSILVVLISMVFIGIPLLLAPVWGMYGNVLRVLCFTAGWLSLYPASKSFARRRSYLE
jgi:hypothetical protein